jgi:S-adenosylmethionine:tRNA ribosyltransferase-isomerase
LFENLEEKGITHQFVTLHVGAGTFKPVKASTMQEHEMHAEFIDVSIDLIESLLTHKTIITVGTTSFRTVESLYWMGVKVVSGEWLVVSDKAPLGDGGSGGSDGGLTQWDAYELPQDIKKEEALLALINWMKASNLSRLITKTQLLVAPGYQLRIAKGLVTNFHQPQSTLLLLVAAIIGDDWRRVYDYALANDFRFLSYGDGCLFLSNTL